MGMPRYLKNLTKKAFEEIAEYPYLLFAAGVMYGHDLGIRNRGLIDGKSIFWNSSMDMEYLAKCMLKYVVKRSYGKWGNYRLLMPWESWFHKIRIEVYGGYYLKDDSWVRSTKDFRLSQGFLATNKSKIDALFESRAKEDYRLLLLRERINVIRDRVYGTRTFPDPLKLIIFERDQYTCRACTRHRDVLRDVGHHLEVDHIVAWEDGGETTYKNGQTLCSACNKAKHHAKTYLTAVHHLRR